jgi:hypothetical protein
MTVGERAKLTVTPDYGKHDCFQSRHTILSVSTL